MPTSDPRQLAPILAELQRLGPVSILDVGAGYGKYGVLAREYLDDWQWQIRIDAVEPFEDYFDRSSAASAYDNRFQVDVRDFRPAGVTWDVILLVDVLEHFEKDEGRGVLMRLLESCRYLLVATPREPADQGHPPPYGNALETHRSRWRESDLADCTYAHHLAPEWHVERFIPVPGDDQLVVTLKGWAE